MQFFKNTVGLIAILSVIPACYAATSRPTTPTATSAAAESRVGVGAVASRIPTLSTKVTKSSSSTTTTTTTGSTTSSALLANAECIDAYTECIKGADVCGENFEECTTNVLFHGKMPNCLSTLGQCSSAGVESLFGTSNIAALSNVSSKNSYDEVTGYTYPTDGSIMGQMITAAAISNRYDTSTCIRRYTSCLKKEFVCGSDFELCTTDKEFKKQRVFCDSTLARCAGDGVKELFGSASLTAAPSKTSRVGEMISEGAALAAVNAVSTCYKSVDKCIENACAENPYKCYENSSQSIVDIVDAINNGTPLTTELIEDMVSKSSIAAYIKNSCFDTIGSSKYCYATFIGDGQMPTNAQLRDEDNQAEIYEEAYSARMNASMKAKIADLVDKFDTKAKQKCTEIIKSCAMRVCGGGSGAACYSAVFGNSAKSVNGSATYDDIKTGCASIVNTDTNCKYAAANPNATGPYTYSYINRDAFDILFPEYDDGAEKDVIGVIASLNASLASSYNDAALANMKKQCQTLATSCVKSMCGSDYVNCYRSRTDVYSDLTNTNNDKFNMSMNKVGGVLDYTIVLGLCLDTVKNASSCEEHLAIEANKIKMAKSGTGSWGGATSVRDGWIDAGAATNLDAKSQQVPLTDAYGNKLCRTVSGEECVCNTVSEINGEECNIQETVDFTTYVQSQAASSLFKDLIYDIEKEAQAKYNAKLNHEQQMCLTSNAGGIIANGDMGSTFMWVKLKGNRVPKDYTVNGLKTTAFTASNDLYGSFCRVRVTLQSDDKKIQDAMKGKSWTTAYFATGDSFTCGSWIPERDLQDIANDVASEKTQSMRDSQDKTAFWTTLIGTIGGGIGGYALGENIRSGDIFPGLTGNTTKVKSDPATNAKKCLEEIESFKQARNLADRKRHAENAGVYAANAGVNKETINNLKEDLKEFVCPEGGCFSSYGTETVLPASENKISSSIASIESGCKANQNAKPETKERKFWAVTPITTAVSAAASGLTVWKATRDIQDANLTAAEKAAYNEWMSNVGRHITCYIGGDEAGSYGDVITTSLE